MAAAWNDLPVTGGLNECGALVRSAEALRVSAPELAVQLARRALLLGVTDSSANSAGAGEARMLAMRAQAVLAGGLVRVSQHVNAVEPGFAALALAESGGAPDVAAEVRLDLAACAQELGEPLLGGALLRPVLEDGQAPPSVRAAALGRLVGCVAHVARRDDVEDALAEADRLLAADDGLSPDARRMERARLAVRSAAYHRWYGDTEDAATAARDGLALLNRLRRELRSESDRLRARLVFELVCALLDDGELRDAEKAATPTVDEPVRATSAESVSQLMLAVATRVHLPSGQVERGRSLLDQAAWVAERHGLDSVLADALTEVSRLDELEGRTADALTALRGARAAEQRRLRAMSRAARFVLTEVGAGMGAKDVTKQAVAALLRQLTHPAGVPVAMAPQPKEEPAAPKTPRSQLPPPRTSPEPHATPPAGELTGTVVDTDKGTGLLNQEGLVRRLRSVRNGERPVALTVVRFEPNNEGDKEDRGPDTGLMAGLADKVRDIAPDNAELARPDGGELAVLLPDTTRDQAEEFAATIRETAVESAWLANTSGKDMSISTGVAQDEDPQGDAEGMLTAARDALTPAAQQATAQPASTPAEAAPVRVNPDTSLAETAAALQSALSEETPTKPRPTPQSALSEDTPTRPISAAGTADLTVGRSILSSLSIPTGSGGRRRADGEPPPGSGTTWPAESSEALRGTRAERRARESENWPTDPTPTPPSGWPAEPDISQPLRPARPHTPTPGDLPVFGSDQVPALSQRTGKRRAPDPEPQQSARRQPEAAAPGFPSTGYSLEQALSGFTAGRAANDQPETTPESLNPTSRTAPTTAGEANTPTTPPMGLPALTPLQAETPAAAAQSPAPTPGPLAPTAEHPASAAHLPATADPRATTALPPTTAADLRATTALPPNTGAEPSATPAQTPATSTEAEPTQRTGRRRAPDFEFTPLAATAPGTAESPATAARPPAIGAQPPAAELRTTATEQQAFGAQPPAFGAQSPATAAEPPASNAQASAFGGESRAFGAQPPVTAAQPPAIDAEPSPFGAQPPAFGAEAPAFGPQSPATAAEPPASNAQASALGAEAPAFGAQAPAFGAEPPASGAPVFGAQAPAIDAEPPASAAQVPAIGAEAEINQPVGRRRVPDEVLDSASNFSSMSLTANATTGDSMEGSTSSAGSVAYGSPFAMPAAGAPNSSAGVADGASSYEETRAELARMMSVLNSGEQSIPRPPEPDEVPEPPTRPAIPEPPEPDPIPPVPTEPGPATPEVPDVPRSEGRRSGLMAAFDALTAPVSGDDQTPFRADFGSSTELPSRKPRTSWAEIESAAVIDSPADNLFGRPLPKRSPGTPFKSSLGAAFEEFGAPPTEEPAPKASEPTYSEPLGPPPRPHDLPRRDRSDSTTIAGLLAEAMAAYQSTTEHDAITPSRESDRFDTFLKHADLSADRNSADRTRSAGSDSADWNSAGPDRYVGPDSAVGNSPDRTSAGSGSAVETSTDWNSADRSRYAGSDSADWNSAGPDRYAGSDSAVGTSADRTSTDQTSADRNRNADPDSADSQLPGFPGRHRSSE